MPTPLPQAERSPVCADEDGTEPDGTRELRPWLPNLLREMAETFSLDVALRFAECFGGQYLWLPAEARPDHPIAQQFGEPVLTWLVGNHARLERIIIPKGPSIGHGHRWAEFRRLLAAGMPASRIAATLGLHVRTIHAWKRRLRSAEAARPGAARPGTARKEIPT
jgi:hypothetical protein